MEIIQSPTVPRLQQNLWLDSTNNTLNAPTKDGWKSITSSAGGGGGMTEVTHDELVSLRNEGKLTPGALYRITDYVATTTQQGTKSANHPFDIVVVALDEKTLSEDAGAVLHEMSGGRYVSVTWTEGVVPYYRTYVAPFLMDTNITYNGETEKCSIFLITEQSYTGETWAIYNPNESNYMFVHVNPEYLERTDDGYIIPDGLELDSVSNYTLEYNESYYFADSRLPAWELKYCLDNDTDRFAWAVKEIPAVEGVPYSFMIIDNGSSAIFTRYPNSDLSRHYAFAMVVDSEDLPFDSPDLDYTNVDLTHVFFTEEEHPNTGDMLWIMNSMGPGEYFWVPVGPINGPTTEGQPGGKGVIYWMKDEHNNEAPFDFKGILFSIPAGNLNSSWLNAVFPDVSFESIDLYYLSCVVPSGQELTFDNVKDASTLPQFYNESKVFLCQNNIEKQTLNMGKYHPHSLYYIPVNVIVNTNKENGYVTWLNNYFNNCSYNFIGNNCRNITLYGATMGFITNQCDTITIKNSTNYYIGSDCYNIDITDTDDAQITCENQVCDVRVLPGVFGEVTIPMESSVQMRYVGIDSNNNLKIWNPADTAPQTP